MGEPAVVLGDRVIGACPAHQLVSPSPSPLPFSAPLMQDLATAVLIAGNPAAVAGSWGLNTPPHVGVMSSDPFFGPPLQRGMVVAGSATVLFEGRPAAKTGSASTCCATPGQLVGSAATVLIGG